MTFQWALTKTREGCLVHRKTGSMTLYMKRDEYGFLKTGIKSPDLVSIVWHTGARLHDDDMKACNWKEVKDET